MRESGRGAVGGGGGGDMHIATGSRSAACFFDFLFFGGGLGFGTEMYRVFVLYVVLVHMCILMCARTHAHT